MADTATDWEAALPAIAQPTGMQIPAPAPPGRARLNLTVKPQAGDAAKETDWEASLPAVTPTAGMLASQKPDERGTFTGMGKNLLAGVAQGVAGLADTISQTGPGSGMFRPSPLYDLLHGTKSKTLPTFGEILQQPQTAGIDLPGTGAIESHGAAERVARAAGVGLGSAALPIPGAGLAANAVNVGANALGMAAGQAASEFVPENYKPFVNAAVSLPASLAAGKIADMGVSAIKRGTTALGAAGIGAKPQLNENGAPFVGSAGPISATNTQMERLGEKLRNAADTGASEVAGPPALGVDPTRGAFEGPAAAAPLIPPSSSVGAPAAMEALAAPGSDIAGVQRTTAQQTQNPGLVALEGTYRQAYHGQFNQRAAQQAQGMAGELGKLAPEGAVAQSPGRYVADLARQMDDAEAQASTVAAPVRQATEAMGGTTSPSAQGVAIRTGVEQARAPVKVAASTPWNTLKADPTLAVSLTPMFDVVKRLAAEQSPTAASVPGLSDVYSFIGNSLKHKPTVTFQELSDLMRNTSALERSLKNDPKIGNESPAMHVLRDFKSSLYDSIAHTVDLTNAREASMVSAGMMRPEETLAARLDAEALRGAGQQAESRATGGTGGAEGTPAASGAIPGTAGSGNVAGVPGTARPGGAAGNSGVAGAAPLEPNFPQGAADLYASARPTYAKYKETYRTGPVGEILQPGPGGPGTYRLANADAVRKFFDSGTKTPEQLQRLAEAMGGMDKVEPIAREVLAWQLRRANVIGQDGMIDAKKFAQWSRTNQHTLNLFPNLSREFKGASNAQMAYDATMAQIAQTKKDFQKSAAAYFLNRNPAFAGVDPAQSVAEAFRGGPQALQAVNKLLAPNPDALAGWKTAVTDYILSRFRSARPATGDADFIKSGEFRKFIDQNRDSLKAVYGGQGVNRIEAIEGELRRQAYSAQAGTGSPTTQYLIGAKGEGLVPGQKSGHTTLLALMGAHLGERMAGSEHAAGLLGGAPAIAGAAATGWASGKIGALKQNGIDSMNALVREALLNPNFARIAMQRVPASAELSPAWIRRIGAALIAGKAAGGADEQQQ